MKIKFFMNTSRTKLEKEVNSFIASKSIWDIKMTEDDEEVITLMVIYKENDENA